MKTARFISNRFISVLSALLAFIMLVGLIPPINAEAAVPAIDSFTDTYKNSYTTYYNKLIEAKNANTAGADRLISIAQSQVGLTYPEPAYWCWGSNAGWCNAFVAWCGYQAGFKDGNVIAGADRSKRDGSWSYGISKMISLYKEWGVYTGYGTSDYVSDIKAGDVIFLDGTAHVAIVESVSGDTVNCIDGNWSNSVKRQKRNKDNTKNSGSVRKITGVAHPKYCSHDSDYTNKGRCSKCGAWAPYLETNVTVGTYKVASGKTAYLRVHPYQVSNESIGELLATLSAGTQVTVTGAVINGINGVGNGNTWYKVTYNGKSGFIVAGSLTLVSAAASELKISPAATSYTITKGSSCSIGGSITSNYTISNAKGTLDGSVYSDFNPNAKSVNIGDSSSGKLNSFKGASLSVGTHSLVISATDSSGKTVTKTITITVQDGTTYYTVYLDANGGSVSPNTISVAAGEKIGNIPDATHSEFDFYGWYTERLTSGQVDGTEVDNWTIVNSDITVYARWFCKLSFYGNGGVFSSGSSAMGNDGEIGRLLSERSLFNNPPTRDGYTFVGWYTDATAGMELTGDIIVNENLKLYAHWECNSHTWNSGSVTKAATYFAEGERTYTCTKCGAAKTEAIAKLGLPSTPALVKTVSYGGNTYKLYASSKNWTESKAWCEAQGGYLATITDGGEQRAIESLFDWNAIIVWLGGEEVTTGSWRWVSGEKWEYTNWSTGQPDTAGGTEHYLSTFFTLGMWNDYPNESEWVRGFVMEVGNPRGALAKPVITAQPTAVTVANGKTATFKVVASGTGLSYQWQYSADGGKTWKTPSFTSTTASISFEANAARNGLLFRCIVKNSAGSVTSSSAKLTVITKPVITTQPTATTVANGKTATFKVVATGTSISYQWQYSADGGKTWKTPSFTSTTASISFEANAARNGLLFRCVVKNSAGTVTSSSAKLTVSGVKPVITTQPTAVTAASGSTATFKIVAAGTGLTYQWQYSSDGGKTWKNTSFTSNAATVSMEATSARNALLFHCVVKNAYGTATSNPAKLTVMYKPAITTQPKSVTVANGNTATFLVMATGSSLTYQWQYSADNGKTWKTPSFTSTAAAISMTASAARNGLLFRCTVKNAVGSVTTSSVRLTVSGVKPAIAAQPTAVTVASGKTATFKVVAVGTGLSYQWQYSSDGGKTWKTPSFTSNTATISMTANAARNGLLFRCVVTNSYGSVTSNAVKLTVG